MRTIPESIEYSQSMFVTIEGDIYVEKGYYGWMAKLKLDGVNTFIQMQVDDACGGLFIDTYNYIYCSTTFKHKVMKQSLSIGISTLETVAGNGSAGSAPHMLNTPYGIFIDVNVDLYVADCENHRIQMFKFGVLDGTTVAGNGSVENFELNCPTSIILDADQNLFIVERGNHRIVRSGPNGSQCLFGCSGQSGSASDQLKEPYTAAFDSHGNIFVTDSRNNRVQKFILATNSCGKYIRPYLIDI
jgi:hypothetical protein